MIDKRRNPRAALWHVLPIRPTDWFEKYVPASSGPRCTMAEIMRSSVAADSGSPSADQAAPAIPHIVAAPLKGIRPHLGQVAAKDSGPSAIDETRVTKRLANGARKIH